MRRGFTLIELLVVIAIIGILAGIVLSSLGTARTSSFDARRLAEFKTMQTALEQFYLKYGKYPCGYFGSVTPGQQIDIDYAHAGTQADSFLDVVEGGSFNCNTYGGPSYGLVTEGFLRAGLRDPTNNQTQGAYVYEVLNNLQTYILYVKLQNNPTKMAGDGGFENCFYEAGNGVGIIDPSIGAGSC